MALLESLRSFREDIISSLRSADVSTLIEDLIEQGLLAREDVDFNPYSPHYEQVSRLLSLVCEQLSQQERENAVRYSEQLLDVLSKHGLSEDLMSKLKYSSHDQHSMLSTAKHVINREESPAGNQVNMPSGTKRRRGHFTDQHILILTEILVHHSHMWECLTRISVNTNIC